MRVYYPRTGGLFTVTFDGWTDLLDSIKSYPYEVPESKRSSITGKYGFSLTHSLAEALILAEDGWTEKADEVRETVKPIVSKLCSTMEVQEATYDVVPGFALDIGRYVSGDPECWQSFDTSYRETCGKHCSILYNYGASGGVAIDAMVKRGVLMTALIESLEFAGIRVQLTCTDVSGPSMFNSLLEKRPLWEMLTIVKSYDQPLDLARVIFACAHPSMQRRLGFAAMEMAPKDVRKRVGLGEYGDGYGIPMPACQKADIVTSEEYFPTLDWTDTAAVEAWLVEQLTKQGVTFAKSE